MLVLIGKNQTGSLQGSGVARIVSRQEQGLSQKHHGDIPMNWLWPKIGPSLDIIGENVGDNWLFSSFSLDFIFISGLR